MKKCKQFIKKWYPFLIVIGMIVGPIVYHIVAVQVEIHNLVYGQELKDKLDSYFTKRDEHAFTSEGIIQSYAINPKTVERTPMGGVRISVSVNGDESVQVGFMVTRFMPSREISLGAIVESQEFKKLLEGNQ
ncbi:DUF1310 family protein [uncultured Abiotrophia sp.]|uniref:DUF1310 family protein n=1 Tax=uncultured Abiotrophia sp. TaxID=316094 RepID=UPI0028E2D925|nr:DUF1310 family protein [uncultured Abiotrophia sp.]